MGRRRRRVVKIVKKKLPTVFSCPSCGEESIKVALSRASHHATVQCAGCGLKEEIEASPADQVVDVYCRFTDRFYGVGVSQTPKQERTFEEEVTGTQAQVEIREESEEKSRTVEKDTSAQLVSDSSEGEPEVNEASDEPAEGPEQAANEESQGEQSSP